jgi:hypothetical protein
MMGESLPSRKSTWQKKLLWVGLVLTVICLCVLCFVLQVPQPLSPPPPSSPPCSTFKYKKSFVGSMTDHESKILTVSLYGGNQDGCTASVQLAITNFDISPPETVQAVRLFANQTTQVVWVLSPKSQGNFSYVVTFPGSQNQSPDGSTVKVTNDVGLPAWVTSVLVPLAVAVLGPLLTVPYWIDKCAAWIKKRKRKPTTRVRNIRKKAKRR